MLTDLQVSHFAIIKNLSLPFQNGLNVLSGETGAGKSIILKSLALLMGEKAFSDTVRAGATQATIEGAFDIADRPDIQNRIRDMGIPVEDDQLVVKRVISQMGKSKVYLNGSLSTLSNLREIVSPLITVTGQLAPLIEITGQHDNRHLQSKSYHLDLLDQYSGQWKLRQEFKSLFDKLSSLIDEKSQLQQKAQEREQRLDFLKFQENEIESLNLNPHEDEGLEDRYKSLSNSSKLTDFSQESERALFADDDSALTRLQRVLQRISDLERLSPGLKDSFPTLHQAETFLEEAESEFRQLVENLECNPFELEALASRISQIKKLQKKHGSTIELILKSLDSIKKEIQQLENVEDQLEDLDKSIQELRLELRSRSEDLHKVRIKNSQKLQSQVNIELQELNMKGVELVIQIEKGEMNSSGMTKLEFMIRSGKNDTPRSLGKFASGGELSRLLLSLKKVVGTEEHPRTYLFDEVDAGVSGPTAQKVGRKLRSISEGQQVICVTHLPQVAAFAHSHFLIEKSQSGTEISMKVSELDSETRVKEIARLISGERISDTSLQHAKQLLAEH